MKKFDRILRETYRILLEQDPAAAVDPNMDPNAMMDPSMSADLGAAAPEPEPVTSVLSPAGEVALTELIYLALYIDPKDIPAARKAQIEKMLPKGTDSISPNNAKQVIALLSEIIIPGENPNIALDAAEKRDIKIIDSLPKIPT